jgi:DNA-binding transcriptional LysR family regulator
METTAALRLPPLLAELRRRHPDIDLELDAQPSAALLMELAAGRSTVPSSTVPHHKTSCNPGPCSAKSWCWSADSR